MTYRRKIFTDAELKHAKQLRLNGTPWRDLAVEFDCDYQTVRRHIDPQFRNRRAEQIANARIRHVSSGRKLKPDFSSGNTADRRPAIPADVLAEWDHVKSATPTLTALLCGDPAPGRSALDKLRRGETP